jgi:hypothetical protein
MFHKSSFYSGGKFALEEHPAALPVPPAIPPVVIPEPLPAPTPPPVIPQLLPVIPQLLPVIPEPVITLTVEEQTGFENAARLSGEVIETIPVPEPPPVVPEPPKEEPKTTQEEEDVAYETSLPNPFMEIGRDYA